MARRLPHRTPPGVDRKAKRQLLLDTHTLLWWLADGDLSIAARDAIAEPRNYVAASAVTARGIAIKKSLGKLSAPDDLDRQLAAGGFDAMAITFSHATVAGALPRHHDDPFDRMPVAQAVIEGLTIVTRDARFSAHDVPTMAA